MSKGNTFENDFLRLIFNAVGIANLANNASSGPLTNLFVSLHTSNPGEAGNQQTSEASYSGYARVAVPRTTGGWSVSANVVTNVDSIAFPASGGGSQTVTHFAVGTATSGAGKILYYGQLNSPISIVAGVSARFLPGAMTISED